MARSDEGEFELVLGNKQLISVFLVVVILLGVFFSMGYIVGRSSATSGTEAAKTGGGKAIVVESPTGSQQPATTTADAKPPETKPADPKPADPPPSQETHPEKPSPVSKEPAREAAKETKPPAAPTPAAAAGPGDPAPGEYWQVVATSRPDAEIVMQALTKKGFHAVIAPVPNDTRFRVLVGPLATTAIQAQIRSDLEASGFKNPIRKKY